MKRIFILTTGVLLLLLLLSVFGLYFTGGIFAPKPPDSDIQLMQNAIVTARKNKAPEYAKTDFADCINSYQSAILEWKLQNSKWIISRDYSKLLLKVRQTTESAIRASRKAIQISGSLNEYITRNIAELKQRDSLFRTRFKNLPLDNNVFKQHSLAHIRLLESIEAYKRGNLSSAFNSLVEAEGYFLIIERDATETLTSYFKSFNQWDNWYKVTLRKSKDKRSYAIVVDKIAHKCILFKNGKIIREYDAELSPKWFGGKNYQGDDATPEGLYFITKKLNSKQTRFHKALLINYPNEEDKRRYEHGVRSGAIPKSIAIGGLIEIHGDGGKGKDWTNGCIALTDKDMDHLFSMVGTGVPVTIIGSIAPLNELFFYRNGK